MNQLIKHSPATSALSMLTDTFTLQRLQIELNSVKQNIAQYNKVLNSISEFESESGSVYATAKQMFAQITTAEAQISSTKFSLSIGYTFPAGSLDWANNLKKLEGLAAVDIAMAQLLTPKGNYNWTTIRKWLQDNLKDLTDAQIAALARTYLDLPTDKDVERFIGFGYTITDIGATGSPNWKLDQTAVFKQVEKTVEKIVIPLALTTLWSDPPTLPNNMTTAEMQRYIERMQRKRGGRKRPPRPLLVEHCTGVLSTAVRYLMERCPAFSGTLYQPACNNHLLPKWRQ